MTDQQKTSDKTKDGALGSRVEDSAAPPHVRNAVAAGKKNSTAVALRVLLALLLCGAVTCFGYVAWQQGLINQSAKEINATATPDTPEKSVKPVDNPIDFESLQAENADVYAWIYIPKTNINLPVLQHPTDDNFYMNHNRYGAYSVEGAIFSQMINSKDFSDPVTLLYGHNLKSETMFSQLHYFESKEFFDENETMYIYTPGHILTYRIIAAYQYDNRHIMNSFDFEDPTVVQEYFDFVSKPDALICNVREGLELNASENKIVQLSTCTGDANRTIRRYIVTGELIDDQPTY